VNNAPKANKAPQPKKPRNPTVVAGVIGAAAVVAAALVTGLFSVVGTLMAKPPPSTTPALSSTPTMPSTSPSSVSPSPEVVPKKQSINATTDIYPEASESQPPQHGALRVSARHIVANTCDGAPGWRVPLSPNRLGSAPYDPSGYSMPKWAKTNKGVEVSGTRIELTLKGTTKSAVVIEGIEASIISKVKPATGTHVVPYGECGGKDQSNYLVAKLDDTPPQIYEGKPKYVDHVEVVRKKSDRSFSARIFHVSRSDPEKFVIVAYGSKLDYVWQLNVRWQDPEGEEYITTVNNEYGRPFSTGVELSRDAYVSVPLGDGEAAWQKIKRHYGG
jgi:hypothetical protein